MTAVSVNRQYSKFPVQKSSIRGGWALWSIMIKFFFYFQRLA